MRLPPELLQALAIDPERLEARCRFFDAYASAADRDDPPNVEELIELSALSGETVARQGLTWFGDEPEPLEEKEEEEEEDRPEEDPDEDEDQPATWITPSGFRAESGPARHRPTWVASAERADALREAGLTALLIDTGRARDFLLAAADAYSRAGVPYGLFLRQVVEGGGRSGWEAAALLQAGLARGLASPSAELPDALAAAARVRQQQVHLLLAVVGEPTVVAEHRQWLQALVELPHADSPVPIGTSGGPLREWWRLAIGLMHLPEGLDEVRAILSLLANRHGEQLEQARTDRSHWQQALVAADVVDLDVAAAAAIVQRRLRAGGLDVTLDYEEFGDVSPLGLVSIWAGLALAREYPRPDLSA